MIVIIAMIMGNFQRCMKYQNRGWNGTKKNDKPAGKNSDKIDKAFNDAMVVYHVSELYDEAE